MGHVAVAFLFEGFVPDQDGAGGADVLVERFYQFGDGVTVFGVEELFVLHWGGWGFDDVQAVLGGYLLVGAGVIEHRYCGVDGFVVEEV